MRLARLTRAWMLFPLLALSGCGPSASIVGTWQAVEPGGRAVEFRFRGDGVVEVRETPAAGGHPAVPGRVLGTQARVAEAPPPGGLVMLEENPPKGAPVNPGAGPNTSLTEFKYTIDYHANPIRMDLVGIGAETGINSPYIVRFLTPGEVELKLLRPLPGEPNMEAGPNILILRRIQ